MADSLIKGAAALAAGAMVKALFAFERRRFTRLLPKAELHVHLDGSMRPATFLELMARLDADGSGQGDFTTVADIEVTFELCEDLWADGVVYAEVRYCPALHLQKGLATDEVVAAVAAGLTRFNATVNACDGALGHPTGFRQIITALRDLGPLHAADMAALASRHKAADVGNQASAVAGAAPGRNLLASATSWVVGFDLAGNEHLWPPHLFAEAYDVARAGGLGLTCHAGEGCDDASAANVAVAVGVLKCHRVGHAVAAKFSPVALDALKQGGVVVETCPSSNCHTCPAIPTIAQSPCPWLWAKGVACAPCADNTLLSRTTTSEEYALLLEHTELKRSDLRAMAAASLNAAFDKGAR